MYGPWAELLEAEAAAERPSSTAASAAGPLTAHALTHVWRGASTADWKWCDFQREKPNRGAKEERRNNAEKPDPGQRKENSHGPR